MQLDGQLIIIIHDKILYHRLSFTEIMSIPELRENPFRLRICEVFASSGRGIGFEDFLDMCSVFSEGHRVQ